MSRCKYCGFDSRGDSIYAEGAPCGVNGCLVFTCCMDTWAEHCKKAHSIYYEERKLGERYGEKK